MQCDSEEGRTEISRRLRLQRERARASKRDWPNALLGLGQMGRVVRALLDWAIVHRQPPAGRSPGRQINQAIDRPRSRTRDQQPSCDACNLARATKHMSRGARESRWTAIISGPHMRRGSSARAQIASNPQRPKRTTVPVSHSRLRHRTQSSNTRAPNSFHCFIEIVLS